MVFFTVQFLSIHIDPIQLVVSVHPIIWALQQAEDVYKRQLQYDLCPADGRGRAHPSAGRLAQGCGPQQRLGRALIVFALSLIHIYLHGKLPLRCVSGRVLLQ